MQFFRNKGGLSALIFTLIVCFQSCKQNNHFGVINNCPSIESIIDVSVSMSDSVKIIEPPEYVGPWGFYTYYKSQKAEYIVHSANGEAIQMYNMTDRILEFVIEPNASSKIIGRVDYAYVHNLDSIFLFRGLNPRGYLVNLEGELLDSWDLTGAPINWPGADSYTLYESSDGFIFKNGKFHFELNTSSFYGITDRSDIKTQGIYDPKNRKWERVFGNLPDFYATNDPVDFVATLTQPTKVIANDQIIISYPLSHEIHAYDMKGNLLKVVCAASTYIKKLEEPVYKQGERDRQQEFIRMSATPAYLGLYYHKDLNVYTRLARHKFDMVTESGGFRSPCEVEFSLIVLDQDLNKISELKLDDYKYDWRFAIPTSKGFWSIPICTEWKEEDYFRFSKHLDLNLSQY